MYKASKHKKPNPKQLATIQRKRSALPSYIILSWSKKLDSLLKKPKRKQQPTPKPNSKMGKGLEQTFLQRRCTASQEVYEKILKITNHHGNANINHDEISPHIY